MQVQHLPEQQQFVMENQTEQAILQYRVGMGAQGAWVDFYHTFVPPSLRGQGVAAVLTAAGLTWAQQQNLRVVASCSYVARYLAAKS